MSCTPAVGGHSFLVTLQSLPQAEFQWKTLFSALRWLEFFLEELDNAELKLERAVNILSIHRYPILLMLNRDLS